jgi:hypothetical protein
MSEIKTLPLIVSIYWAAMQSANIHNLTEHMARVKQAVAEILLICLLSLTFIGNGHALPTDGYGDKKGLKTVAGKLLKLACEKAEELNCRPVSEVMEAKKQEYVAPQQKDGLRHDRQWAQHRVADKEAATKAKANNSNFRKTF